MVRAEEMFRIGQEHAAGHGVFQSDMMAYALYCAADVAGYPVPEKTLKVLAAKLSADEIEVAQRLIELFRHCELTAGYEAYFELKARQRADQVASDLKNDPEFSALLDSLRKK